MIQKQKRKLRKILWICITSIILICFLVFTETNVRPIMLEVAINDAQAVNEKVINKAVYDALNEKRVDFSSVIKVSYDDSNNVKSVETDSVFLGRLKLKIINNIADGFKNLDIDSVGIRLGSFIDNEFTYGRGPNIKFNYEMSNTVDCEYKSDFISVGINQTKHNFAIVFTTEVCIITPLFQTNTTFKSEVLINEMIIVGSVPSTYADINT